MSKEIEKLKKKIKELKKEIRFLNMFISEAHPEDWDLQGIYEDIYYGRIEGYYVEEAQPNKKFAEWIRKRYNLDKIEEEED